VITISKPEPIRVAVIGVGEFGLLHLEVLQQLQQSGQVQIVALAARTDQTVQTQSTRWGVVGYTDYRALLEQEALDAVTVATPDHLHREMTLAAIDKGLHVLVEKPMDTSASGAAQIVRAAEDRAVLVEVDFHKRFDPSLQAARQIIAAGKTGPPQYAYACMDYKIMLPRDLVRGWVAQTDPSWMLGIHFYDVLRWLLDSEVTSVYATAVKRKLVGMGIDTPDSVQAHLSFANGAHATVHSDWTLPDEFEARLSQEVKVVGDEGIIEVDLQDRGLRWCGQGQSTQTINPYYVHRFNQRIGGYAPEAISCFIRDVQCVQTGQLPESLDSPAATARDGLAATEIAAAVQHSYQSAQIVTLEETGKEEDQ